jgi:hypothetical protein
VLVGLPFFVPGILNFGMRLAIRMASMFIEGWLALAVTCSTFPFFIGNKVKQAYMLLK